MVDYVITFWENEDIGDPPAVRTKTVKARGITRAVLEWNVQIYSFITGGFRSIELNGHEIGKSSKATSEVSMYVIEDGDNTIKINYEGALGIGAKGKAYVVLRITATSPIIEEKPIEIPKFEWYYWVIIVVIIVLLLAFYFLYTKTKVVQAVAGSVGSVAQTVGGVVK